MNPVQKLVRLAIRNLDQIVNVSDKIEILTQAADLTRDECESRELRVTAQCLKEADQAQLRLIKTYSTGLLEN